MAELSNGVNPDVAMERPLDVLPNLYKAVFSHVLWVICDLT
jgi:hypothetical protein